VLTAAAAAQELVSFPTEDGGVVYADVYGRGERGVVLAHGGPFNKESWAKQAPVLVKAGFRVVAIDFRGRGRSRGGAQASSSSLSLSRAYASLGFAMRGLCSQMVGGQPRFAG
jgi:pimeloyl-ACP methyl ester carboxylesterase